jgi:hypothetical protein
MLPEASNSTNTPPSLPPQATVDNTQAALDKAHRPPPVAAYAIPLSMVGAIILVAAWLAWRQYRKLEEDRASSMVTIDKGGLLAIRNRSMPCGMTKSGNIVVDEKSGKGTPDVIVPTLYSEPDYERDERYTSIPQRTSRWDYENRQSSRIEPKPRIMTREPCWNVGQHELSYKPTDSIHASSTYGTVPARTFRQGHWAERSSHTPYVTRRATDSDTGYFRNTPQNGGRTLTPIRTSSDPMMQPERNVHYSKPLPPAPLCPRYSTSSHPPSYPRLPLPQVSPPSVPERLHVRRETCQGSAGYMGDRGAECDALYDAVKRALGNGPTYYGGA